MFRELQRREKALSPQECARILTQERRGVLSVLGDDGYPYGMPMNHFYDPADGCLYFHCGKDVPSHRTDALRRCSKASFCVYDQGTAAAGDWALTVNSVIVFGTVELVEDRETVVEVSARLSRKFTQDEAYIQSEIEHHAHRTLLLKLTPQHLCGKQVVEA